MTHWESDVCKCIIDQSDELIPKITKIYNLCNIHQSAKLGDSVLTSISQRCIDVRKEVITNRKVFTDTELNTYLSLKRTRKAET